jgi:hypothetical protein
MIRISVQHFGEDLWILSFLRKAIPGRDDTTRLTQTKLVFIISTISYDSTVNVQKKRSKDITEKT